MIQEKKLEAEAQLNKQLTELETMPQKEVDRIIIHDMHGLPIKRHEGSVYKDPRDDPALGSLGRDVLHPGFQSTSIAQQTGTFIAQPIATEQVMGMPMSQSLQQGGTVLTEEQHLETETKKRGFFARMKVKYHDWKERRRQKKLARERGEPTSPLSPSPTRESHMVASEPSRATGHFESTLRDVKNTGNWDFSDQRMATAQVTLLDENKEVLAPVTTTTTTTTAHILPQTELRSGIIHPGLSEDFTNRPQAEFLVAQTTLSSQSQGFMGIQQPQFQQQFQPGMVIDDMTRPAKNLLEGVSGAYGLAANPFQSINEKGMERVEKRLSKNPEMVEPRGVGVENIYHTGGQYQSTTGGQYQSTTGLGVPTFQAPFLQGTTSTMVSQPMGITTTKQIIEPGNVQQFQAFGNPLEQYETTTFNLPTNIENTALGLSTGVNPEFYELQQAMLKAGTLKPSETIISVGPVTQVTENLEQLTLDAKNFLNKNENLIENMSVQPGMSGDLTTGLTGGRIAAKESEKAKPNPLGSSH